MDRKTRIAAFVHLVRALALEELFVQEPSVSVDAAALLASGLRNTCWKNFSDWVSWLKTIFVKVTSFFAGDD